MRICVIFNPAAKGEKAIRFRRQLERLAGDCVLKPTDEAGAGSRLAAEAVDDGFDTVIAAGGDGTINEVVNGIASVEGGLTRTRLGVMPTGTMNVFARELGIPLHVEKAWTVIQQGRETRIDLPRVEFKKDGAMQIRHFAQLAGAGLDAQAIELVDGRLKKGYGPVAYALAGLRALTIPRSNIRIKSNGATLAGQLVIIGNGRYYGGTFPLHPQANFRDGLLDVCVFPEINWFVALRYVWGFLRQRLVAPRKESSFQAPSVIMEGDLTPFELDGDNVGHLPATFSIEREALRVITPNLG